MILFIIPKNSVFKQIEVNRMLGLIVEETEKKELEYLIKRELEELLLDLGDHRIDAQLKQSMKDRYQRLFQLLLRVGSKEDCLYYLPQRNISKLQ